MDHFCGWLIVTGVLGAILMTVIVWNFTDLADWYAEWKFRRQVAKNFDKKWRK